jgi:hypothetical protein
MGAELIAGAISRCESLICRAAGQQRSIADQSLPLVLDPRIRLILKLHLCSAPLGGDWSWRAACRAPPGSATHLRLAARQSLVLLLTQRSCSCVVRRLLHAAHQLDSVRACVPCSSDTHTSRSALLPVGASPPTAVKIRVKNREPQPVAVYQTMDNPHPDSDMDRSPAVSTRACFIYLFGYEMIVSRAWFLLL